MDSNRKRFSLGWYTGVILGIAASGAAVYAVTLPHNFTDGSTASAAQVNANFQALKDAIDGCTTDMVRVGSTCVDKDAQVATTVPPGCQPTGKGCNAIVVQSQATAGNTNLPFSWGQAVAACTNAGKRLASGREIIAAYNAGAVTIADGSYLFVDASAARDAQEYAGTFAFLRNDGTGVFELGGTQTPYTQTWPNTIPNVVAFRCAR